MPGTGRGTRTLLASHGSFVSEGWGSEMWGGKVLSLVYRIQIHPQSPTLYLLCSDI
jgi:hypothetical protein